MTSGRASGTATLLRDGRVLLCGGYPGEGRDPQSSAEVFDPSTGSFAVLAPMTAARAEHSATLLQDGRVLLAGGTGADGRALVSTELFDPATGAFTAGPPLPGARSLHAAVAVGAQLLLVGGSADMDTGTASTALLSDGTWAAGPDLQVPRVKHAAVGLVDGRVLVIGGSQDVEGTVRLASTEHVDLAAGVSSPGPELPEPQYKLDGAVAELPDGRVVIAGGRQLDVYDPTTEQIVRVGEPAAPRRSFVSASVVGRGRVLVAGGYDDAIVPTAAARVVRVPP
jgi:hypothetical protein